MGIAESIDLAVWPQFYAMQQRGIRVDTARMEALLADVRAQMASVSVPFNPASSDEVAAWMDKQGMTGKRTKKKRRLATDERSLSAYGDPVLSEVVRFRGLQKLEGTFILPVLGIAAKTGGLIHPRWRLTKVKSGRVACEDPNLLAFPSRDEMGRKVRSCFVPRSGFALVSIDYSQLEPRITAAISKDPELLDVYATGKDLYQTVAAKVGVTRTEAKTLTLGTLYGIGAKRLYEQLVLANGGNGWDVEGCERLIRDWFKTFSGVRLLIDRLLTEARSNGGWATTHFGRRRYLPGLYLEGSRWPAAKLREESERQCLNHRIQGTAAETLKLAQIRLAKQVPQAIPLLAIHDEVVAEIPEATAEEVATAMASVMSTEFEGVHLTTTHKIGYDWGSLK